MAEHPLEILFTRVASPLTSLDQKVRDVACPTQDRLDHAPRLRADVESSKGQELWRRCLIPMAFDIRRRFIFSSQNILFSSQSLAFTDTTPPPNRVRQ